MGGACYPVLRQIDSVHDKVHGIVSFEVDYDKVHEVVHRERQTYPRKLPRKLNRLTIPWTLSWTTPIPLSPNRAMHAPSIPLKTAKNPKSLKRPLIINGLELWWCQEHSTTDKTYAKGSGVLSLKSAICNEPPPLSPLPPVGNMSPL